MPKYNPQNNAEVYTAGGHGSPRCNTIHEVTDCFTVKDLGYQSTRTPMAVYTHGDFTVPKHILKAFVKHNNVNCVLQWKEDMVCEGLEHLITGVTEQVVPLNIMSQDNISQDL